MWAIDKWMSYFRVVAWELPIIERSNELFNNRAKVKDDFAGWMKEAKDILKGNPWISDVKEHFGQKGTNYDFTGYEKIE